MKYLQLMNQTFFEFTEGIRGYDFFSKKTGYQIFRFEMYWKGLTPKQCFELFNFKIK